MTDHTPLDLLALRRHILSQFGVNLWSQKDKSSIVLPAVDLRGRQDFDEPIAIKSLPTHDTSTATAMFDTKAAVSLVQPYSDEPSVPNPNMADTPKISTDMSTMPIQGVVAHDERFGLLGIGCADWLLLADQAYLTQETYALWQSLAQALQKQHPSTMVLTLSYPLFADEEGYHRQPTPALLGFLLGLHAHKRLYLGLLSAWSQSIVLGSLLDKQQDVPSLEQMQYKPLLKKQLWNTLVSTLNT